MDNQGYVYVLINPSMEGLVKIGKTTKTPTERAKELSVATGVPTPFMVVYECYFENCSRAEEFVHTYLEEKGFRVSRNREFFEIPTKNAIDAVIEAENSLGKFDIDENSYQEFDESIEPWNDLLEKAEGYLYGWGDYIQDYDDAIKYYLKAIKLGYIQGYQEIGSIYDNMEDHKKAFLYYKEGAEKGCSQCYAGMGSYYLYGDNNLDKASKCYQLYMKYTPEENLFPIHICYYLMLAIKDIVDNDKTNVDYFEKTLPYKEDILKFFIESTHFLPVYYKSIYDIPKESRENIIREYERNDNQSYKSASYSGMFSLTESFILYIESIYSNGYKSPDDIDDVFFKADIVEVV